MVTQIGIVAGEILTLMEDLKRPLHAEEIEFYLDEPAEIILMSLGWLAREGMVRREEKEDEEVVADLASADHVRLRLVRKSYFHLPV